MGILLIGGGILVGFCLLSGKVPYASVMANESLYNTKANGIIVNNLSFAMCGLFEKCLNLSRILKPMRV